MSAPVAPVRVFPDSNVLVEGLFAPWSASRAILILARAGIFRLVLSPYVEKEVERALLKVLAKDETEGSRLINDYDLALKLLAPERTEKSPTQNLTLIEGLSVMEMTCRFSSRRSVRAPTGW